MSASLHISFQCRNPKWSTSKIWIFVALGIILIAFTIDAFVNGNLGGLLAGLGLAAPALLTSLFYFISVRIR